MNTTPQKSHPKIRTAVLILLPVFIIAMVSILALPALRASFCTPPVFYTHSPGLTETPDAFSLSDCYITNKVTGLNRYFIDSQSNLWGFGTNAYGQLGTGETNRLDVYSGTPVWIAEHVVSVDCSVNGYFCIYLTENGELYGMGSNLYNLLGQDQEHIFYDCANADKITRPVLLMDQVAYARAGRESITALKTDGSVWWWGQYMSTYGTDCIAPSKPVHAGSDPSRMLSTSPQKLLDHCIYAATGDYTGAAISENGELYTWGLNIFGECGTPVTGDDYIRTPCKVLEDVRMVWPEQIEMNSPLEDIPEIMKYETVYLFNTFVQLTDGTTLAAGHRLGETEKNIFQTGDLAAETTHTYSDTFVPVEIKPYSEEEVKTLVGQLEIGTDREEVENYLTANGIQYFYVLDYHTDSMSYTENRNEMRDESQTYFFYFNDENKLTKKGIQP